MKFFILELINIKELWDNLRSHITNKIIPSEQWYKGTSGWEAVVKETTDYRAAKELSLLEREKEKILNLMETNNIVIWGPGTGQTEAKIVQWAASKFENLNIIVIDVQRKFIQDFAELLKNLEDINLKGIQNTFQRVERKDIKFNGTSTHICVGNTIGNFPRHQLIQLFSQLLNLGDRVVLGFQTNNQIQRVFEYYQNSKGIETKS
jgi:uncharacterized SAM-dependent methyltransferase